MGILNKNSQTGDICLIKYIWYILLTLFILSLPLPTQAEIMYNLDSLTISEIKDRVHFKVFTPRNVPEDWTLEIKTYPFGEEDFISKIRLHYMDSNDTYMIIGIEERRAATIKMEKLKPSAEKLDISGNVGYFQPWVNSGEKVGKGKIITGGILSWRQEGTLIKMDSSILKKEEMLEIARSMR